MIEELQAYARELLTAEGFRVDVDPRGRTEASAAVAYVKNGIPAELLEGVRDLTHLEWSSIDNVETRDVDQLEVAEAVDGGTLIRIAIADVDAFVPKGSPIDLRAAQNTISVYGVGVLLPMLPVELSEGITSLLPDQDRLALVAELVVGSDGVPRDGVVYRALVRNRVQMDYESLNAWFAGEAALPSHAAPFEKQLRLQQAAAERLHTQRMRLGALEFERREVRAVVEGDEVVDFAPTHRGAARDLIEDFMIAANVVIAGFLEAHNVSWIRRMVGAPERWDRIVEIGAAGGAKFPASPDRLPLGKFLTAERARDPESFAELSLSVLRLLGSGQYLVEHRAEDLEAHFALGVDDYTHFTAPNRRYADVVTQRIVKAVLAHAPCPYTDAELDEIATRCTDMEDKAHGIERKVAKRAAVLLMQKRVGEEFVAAVSSVDGSRVMATLDAPVVDGRIISGDATLAVGQRVRVRLQSVDMENGRIDFVVTAATAPKQSGLSASSR